jgi:transposase InsO family protein
MLARRPIEEPCLGARVVDEPLVAGDVRLPHHRRPPLEPLPASVAERRVPHAVRAHGQDLEVQQRPDGPIFAHGEHRTFDRPPAEAEDERVLRVLEAMHYTATRPIEDALGALIDHPRVFLPSGPARVERSPVRVHAQADEDQVRLEVVLDDRPLSRADVTSDGLAVVTDEARRVVHFGALGTRERALLDVFELHGNVLPAEARARLLPRLGSIVGVLLLGELAGRVVSPSCEMVLRLDARAWPELDLDLRVRPIAGGELQAAGGGPGQVRGSVDGEPAQTTRDFALERATALELCARLGIDANESAWSFRTLDEAVALLSKLRDVEGVSIEWLGPRVDVLAPLRRDQLRVDIAARGGWFEIGAEVEIDERRVSLAMLLTAVRTGQRYVSVGQGKLVDLEADLRDRLQALSDHVRDHRSGGLEVALTAAQAVAELAHTAPANFTRVLERLEQATASKPRVPRHLAKVLRPYQRDGFAWMTRLAAWGAGGVLADDVGLGKMVQTLALLCDRAAEGPAMVVAPTSVVGNWQGEIARLGKGLRAIDDRTAGRKDALRGLRAGDVLLITYDLLRGALEHLGHSLGRTTIARTLAEHGIEPAPSRGKRLSWKTFLAAHAEAIACADFLTVEVLTRAELVRYLVFFVVRLHSRKVHITGIAPAASWLSMKTIARNLTDSHDGFLLGARYLILDHDPLYTQDFRALLRSSDVEPLFLPARSPNLNADAERFVRSIKSECLSKVVLLGEAHLRKFVREHVDYCHEERPHQGLANRIPVPRDAPVANAPVRRRDRLGGLLRYYSRDAA